MSIKVTAAITAPLFAAVPVAPAWNNRIIGGKNDEAVAQEIASVHIDRKAHFVTILREVLNQGNEATQRLLTTFIRRYGGNCVFWAGGAPEHESLPKNGIDRRIEILRFLGDPDGSTDPTRHHVLGGVYVELVAENSYERVEFWTALYEDFPQLANLAVMIGAVPEHIPEHLK